MEIKSTTTNKSPENGGDTERWGSLIPGGALVLTGLSKRSLRGALMAIAGGTLAYHGAAGQKSLVETVTEATGLDKPIRVEKTVTIQNKSPEELYTFWHDFGNLPTFMKHLKSVTVISDTRSHWIANAPLGASVEWDAEIITDRPNQLITWASVEGADVSNSGFVRFQSAPKGGDGVQPPWWRFDCGDRQGIWRKSRTANRRRFTPLQNANGDWRIRHD